MFWRFWAAADPAVERFISRDVCTHGSNVHTEHARAWAASHVCTARVCTARVCMACMRLALGAGAVPSSHPKALGVTMPSFISMQFANERTRRRSA